MEKEKYIFICQNVVGIVLIYTPTTVNRVIVFNSLILLPFNIFYSALSYKVKAVFKGQEPRF